MVTCTIENAELTFSFTKLSDNTLKVVLLSLVHNL